ncbi:Type I restriction modification DNA specificity domain protein [Leuconostoc mesenteroides]|uniref:restriction endonuclease subunit S n=1 Tax=Leuconostoc mesenteroides TaxID=1245 RepID=UPI000CFA7178|nr:restriction endonuclease subunit S [Leuconostoc mesenteroides]SPE14491.1 Type I restriction modification DNA specificity domain protein [Leuconostoc mesenteroides]SPI59759.1 Type I restriction modification DNA specificity domain protein [Leuconostoc mesenteroides]
MGDLANIVRGASPRPIQDPKWFDKESNIGWLRISDVTEQNGRIYHLDQHISKLGQEKTRVLTEPHLLLSIAATVGKPLVNYIKTGVHDGFLIFLDPLFEREFMFQWLEMFRPQWKKYGQPGSQVNLNSELIRNQDILIPGNTEQQKIGSFFKQLDNLITQNERKIDLLKQLKQAYLQKIFSQELRFTGFNDGWEERDLSAISDKVTEKNKENQFSETFTNSAEYGIIDQRDFFDKDISNEKNLNGYYIVHENDFVYNPRISNYAPVGPIKRNKLGRTGVMSPLYYVFRSRGVDKKYLEYYFDTTAWHIFLKMNGDSGARSDRFAIKDSVFNQMPIPYPTIGEQEQIGSFFEKLDKAIALHQQKLDLLKKQKQAYLQKLFI